MPATHFYETDFQIGSKMVLVFAEYTFSAGSPAHYGSLSYPGHPAEPAEIEFVKVELNTTDKDHKTAKVENWFPAPDWLYTILSEDDDVYQEICSQDHTYYPEYEYDDRD
jgi:hypothetical protein